MKQNFVMNLVLELTLVIQDSNDNKKLKEAFKYRKQLIHNIILGHSSKIELTNLMSMNVKQNHRNYSIIV